MSPHSSSSAAPAALRGITVLERGWLSSNNIVLQGADGDPTATLVDTGHCVHAEQTLALLHAALAGRQLVGIVNTHLHSDYCGGNSALQRAFRVPVSVPAASFEAVQAWDGSLGFADVGQRIERFEAQGLLNAGDRLELGGRHWELIAAPGHDPDALMLFDAAHGVLITGDALWQDGFGVVFPELDGNPAFDDVAAVLDRIAGLPVQWVIPGHGSAFDDVDAALARARSRLAAFRADPSRHARHAAKVLLKYHLMEEQRQAHADLRAWAEATPLMRRIWNSLQRPGGNVADWCDLLLAELARSGAAALADGIACNR